MDNSRDNCLLACDPACFAACGKISSATFGFVDSPFAITNRGLEIQLPLLETSLIEYGHKLYIAVLNCRVQSLSSPLGIYLKKYGGKYFRTKFDTVICRIDRWSRAELRSIYIEDSSSHFTKSSLQLTSTWCDFSLRTASLNRRGFTYKRTYFANLANFDVTQDTTGHTNFRLKAAKGHVSAFLLFENDSGDQFVIVVGIT